ncbi:MAG: antibiotic biosynthesis monooxygenase [Myxococcales bacterium]|nr:antibiotic biosynthesis monooxygenase [Myxococcales bacterium]
MIVIRVLLEVKLDQLDAFRAHAADEGRRARALAGCEQYAFFEETGQPGRFLLYEEWASPEAFSAYKSSPELEANGKVIFPMLAVKPNSAYWDAAPLE